MRTREYERLAKRYEPAICGIARNLGKTDDALVEDLEQVGRFALSQLDPSKAKTNPDAWIRKVIYNKMVDFLRDYDPGAYESLDYRMECGDQVERLPNGDLYLISGRPLPPKLLDETQWLDEELGP